MLPDVVNMFSGLSATLPKGAHRRHRFFPRKARTTPSIETARQRTLPLTSQKALSPLFKCPRPSIESGCTPHPARMRPRLLFASACGPVCSGRAARTRLVPRRSTPPHRSLTHTATARPQRSLPHALDYSTFNQAYSSRCIRASYTSRAVHIYLSSWTPSAEHQPGLPSIPLPLTLYIEILLHIRVWPVRCLHRLLSVYCRRAAGIQCPGHNILASLAGPELSLFCDGSGFMAIARFWCVSLPAPFFPLYFFHVHVHSFLHYPLPSYLAPLNSSPAYMHVLIDLPREHHARDPARLRTALALLADYNVASLTPSRTHTPHTTQHIKIPTTSTPRTLLPSRLPRLSPAQCYPAAPSSRPPYTPNGRPATPSACAAPASALPGARRWLLYRIPGPVSILAPISPPLLDACARTHPLHHASPTSVLHRLHPTASLTPIRPQLDVSRLNIPPGDAQELGDGPCEIAGEAPIRTVITSLMKLLLQDHRELEMIGKHGHRDQLAFNLLRTRTRMLESRDVRWSPVCGTSHEKGQTQLSSGISYADSFQAAERRRRLGPENLG
ncbi:hypothetical protein B0H13DRAFT_2347912 [Mycena leptocephala]|nr:hypothetical protein B0H13DRAFT_2347912 [Mycena leptocephala]